ncbi:MAG: ABC transporter permease [Cetobacterium sp.]|uniref:ABC transporter permease n=1 Tax=Cetobacterium sp. TaxID=2071632 RepID=UPI003F3B388B
MKKYILNLTYFVICLFFLLPFMGIFFKSLNFKMWVYVLNSPNTYESLITTTAILFITVLINFIIGTPVAAFLGREKSKLNFLLMILIILPLIIPVMVSTMGLQFTFIKLNLIDTVLGVSVVHSVATIPYYILSMKSGYLTINKDYVKLGKILGANPIQLFFKITLPLIYPSFLVGVSLTIVVSLAQYLITFIIGGGRVITLPILMMPYLVDGGITNGTVYSVIYIIFTYLLLFLLNSFTKNIYRKRELHDSNKQCI